VAEVLNKILDVALVAAIVIAAVVSIGTTQVITNEPVETIHEPTTAPSTAATQEPTLLPTATTHPTTEATEPPETTAETAPPVILYDVPLSEELQQHIIGEAEAHGIDPAIIFAMAYRETTYRVGAIGDSGNSYGLLQIQPRWHRARMQKLGCTDLLDPFQNVTVGVDYLAEQIDRYGGDIAKALTAYNRGHYNGAVTSYAYSVLEKAKELRGSTYDTYGAGSQS
jgi:soluble lytic murein transglycosylase-like protein